METINHDSPLPFKIFFHSVRACSPHWHKELELLFVLGGSLLVHVEGHQSLLGTGDILLINSSEIHLTHETEESNIILAFQLDPDIAVKFDPDFGSRYFLCSSAAGNGVQNKEYFETLQYQLAEIMYVMRKKETGYIFEAASSVYKILNILISHFQTDIPEGRVIQGRIEENSRYFTRISRIIRYIDRNYTKKISSSDLAEREKINPSYLSRFFHEKTGYTFSKYVAFVRLQKSLKSLVSAESNISDIALEYGFSSVKAYNTAFREIMSMTPTEWRNEKQLKNKNSISGVSKAAGDNAYGSFNRINAMNLLSSYRNR